MATIVTSFSFAVRETQSLGQQMLNAPLGINGLILLSFYTSHNREPKVPLFQETKWIEILNEKTEIINEKIEIFIEKIEIFNEYFLPIVDTRRP